MKTIVLRGGALGDGIVTFPVLAALRPESRHLVLVSPSRVGRLALATGLVDETWDLLGAGFLWLHGGAPPPDWRDVDLVVTYVAGTAARLRATGARKVLEGAVNGPHKPIHRQLLSALAPMGLQDASISLELELPPKGEGRTVICPGSGGVRKCWPLDRWLAVSRRLGPCDLDWLAGPNEVEDLPRWPVPTTYDEDLLSTAGRARGAVAWAGVDSGTSHLAALMGCPTVVLFGPTDPAIWAPPGARILCLDDTPETVAKAVLAARAGRGT